MNGDSLVDVVARTSPDELWQFDYCETCARPLPAHQRFCDDRCRREHEQFQTFNQDPRGIRA